MDPYPTECGDMELMYHYILMNKLVLNAEQAAAYSIYGLKHFIITVAAQFDFEKTAIVQLGHWHSNPAMPSKYNQSKCVRELAIQIAIQKQFVAGWGPVGGSELAKMSSVRNGF